MVNKLKILISAGVLVPAVSISFIATHSYWTTTKSITIEELNKLKESIVQNIDQNFKANNDILATNATNEDIKFIGSLPNKVIIKTNIINGSADDVTGKVRFNFYLQHENITSKNFEEIEIQGFKTIEQVKKNMINELATLSSFSPINKDKLVNEINDDNIENEIKWNEQEKFENAIITYFNTEINEEIGMVNFDYKIKINEYESETKQYSAIGWKSIFSTLQKIVHDATFSVQDKNVLASQVTEEQIIWNQQNEENNKEVEIKYGKIVSNDQKGILGFRATFYKSSIKFDLDIDLDSDRAIFGFLKY